MSILPEFDLKENNLIFIAAIPAISNELEGKEWSRGEVSLKPCHRCWALAQPTSVVLKDLHPNQLD